MFKFLVLSAIVAICAAAPAPHGHYLAVQPEYAHVGTIVQHVPVATSHQSRTDYHSKPVVKSVLASVEYIQPVVHHQPAIAYSAPIVHAAPLVHSVPLVHSAPLLHAW